MVVTMSNVRGSRNGPSQVEPFDNWFRYPAGFSKEALDACFAAVPTTPGHLVIDPFAGASTAGVRIAAQGGRFRGIEAHPLVAELSDLKFKRIDTSQLVPYAKEIINEITLATPDNEHLLVRRCFDDGTLSVLAGLRDSIEQDHGHIFQPYLRWALLATLRDCASVKVGWPYQLPGKVREPKFKDAKKRFLARVSAMASDLAKASSLSDGHVIHGDSRDAIPWDAVLAGDVADGCITSPPYLNNFDYADATRLELYFLKYAASWREMTEVVRSTMIVASTQQTNKPSAALAVETLSASPQLLATVQALADQLAAERIRRRGDKQSRTKEYDFLIYQYFSDMQYVINNLDDHLKAGSRTAMIVGDSAPYGIYVDTPAIIAQVASIRGWTCESDIPFRIRGQRWASNTIRHNIPLAERVIVLRKP